MGSSPSAPQRWKTTEDPRPREGDEVIHVVGIFGFGQGFGKGVEHSADGNCCQQLWGFVLGDATKKVVFHGVEPPNPTRWTDAD